MENTNAKNYFDYFCRKFMYLWELWHFFYSVLRLYLWVLWKIWIDRSFYYTYNKMYIHSVKRLVSFSTFPNILCWLSIFNVLKNSKVKLSNDFSYFLQILIYIFYNKFKFLPCIMPKFLFVLINTFASLQKHLSLKVFFNQGPGFKSLRLKIFQFEHNKSKL